ncbi:hypothetical protein HYT60_00575 [Candidatus Woesebacteria bacterium]|nr:hypothetical protein [Candidatus Woesebacteria bacterium]
MRWTERDEERMDFILEQTRKGKTADEIDELRARQWELSGRDRGIRSEQRVIEALEPLDFVMAVGKEKDDKMGNDLWVSFDPDSGHRDIPLQVKSSWTGFFAFRSRQEEGERRIIIKVGPGRSPTAIRRVFLAQLKFFDGFI